MNNTKQIVAAVSLLLFVAVSGYWFGARYGGTSWGPSTQKQGNMFNSNVVQGDAYDMKIVSGNTIDKKMSVYYEYPQFKKVDQTFNTQIKNFMLQSVEEFEAVTEENYAARLETASDEERKNLESDARPFGQFIAKWESVQNNNSTISFVVYVYTYTGGANGSEVIRTFNYDLTRNTEVTLQSVFPNDAEYLFKIAHLIQIKAKEEMQNRSGGELYEEALAPLESNFKNFTISREGITFYYPKYAIAAGVYGDFELFVSFEEIEAAK